MKAITLRRLDLQFDADQSTRGSTEQQARQALELINLTLQCEPFGLMQQGKLMGFSFKERSRKSASGKPLPGEPCIYWSGFWSQGDGACFEGRWSARACRATEVCSGWGASPSTTELLRIAAGFQELASAFPDASFRVKHRGHYSHEHCTEFDFSIADDDILVNDGEIEQAEQQLTDLSRSFMRWIYRQLESAYEDHLSEANACESILANEYEFTEDGERI